MNRLQIKSIGGIEYHLGTYGHLMYSISWGSLCGNLIPDWARIFIYGTYWTAINTTTSLSFTPFL
jgi:hypothetical protein